MRKSLKCMEPASGIEPPTCGLRNRCSATELRRLKAGRSKKAFKDLKTEQLRSCLGKFIPFVTWTRQLKCPVLLS